MRFPSFSSIHCAIMCGGSSGASGVDFSCKHSKFRRLNCALNSGEVKNSENDKMNMRFMSVQAGFAAEEDIVVGRGGL